jgi:hypothetical protein
LDHLFQEVVTQFHHPPTWWVARRRAATPLRSRLCTLSESPGRTFHQLRNVFPGTRRSPILHRQRALPRLLLIRGGHGDLWRYRCPTGPNSRALGQPSRSRSNVENGAPHNLKPNRRTLPQFLRLCKLPGPRPEPRKSMRRPISSLSIMRQTRIIPGGLGVICSTFQSLSLD